MKTNPDFDYNRKLRTILRLQFTPELAETVMALLDDENISCADLEKFIAWRKLQPRFPEVFSENDNIFNPEVYRKLVLLILGTEDKDDLFYLNHYLPNDPLLLDVVHMRMRQLEKGNVE